MNLSYKEALDRCKQSFKTKLMHSVELLRKAERIALMYDNTDGYYLAFSGGKDSQALYHLAELAGVKFKGHMSLTSVDPPQVIRFVKRQYPDVELIKPKMSMFDKAIERGILPTMRVRWCCADFKESAGAGKVTLIGVRAAESARRAKRHEVEVKSRKFGGDLEGFDAWSQAEIEKKLSKTKRKVNEDEFSIKTDNEVRCINGKDSILISPIFQWTEDDVWYFLNEIVNVPHCELYDMGYSRIGCILCPMSNKKSKQRDMKMFPHVKRGWIRAIKAIRSGGGIQGRIHLVEHPNKMDAASAHTGGGISHTEQIRTPLHIGTILRNSNVDSDYQPQSGDFGGTRWTGTDNPGLILTRRIIRKFFDSPSQQVNWGGQSEPYEDEIAEAIFDWWMSGKSYKEWYSEKYMQGKLDLNFEENGRDEQTSTENH